MKITMGSWLIMSIKRVDMNALKRDDWEALAECRQEERNKNKKQATGEETEN